MLNIFDHTGMARPFLFLFLFLPLLLSAQTAEKQVFIALDKVLLRGKVVDAQTQVPLEFATVAVHRLPDSTLANGGLTDPGGVFSLALKPGLYYVRIDYLSYKTRFVGNIDLRKAQDELDLGIIALEPSASALEEVVISAEKSQLQFGLDKKVFNVGKDLANKGGSAADILDNVPSVTVDVEGNVSLRGSENVRILIDGKPSGLVSFGSNGLRQLPANMIDRVEIVTNPSARYEAEGMAGIINIVLKKEQAPGFHGAIDLTAGYPQEYGASLNLNYRRKRFNFFANYGLRYNQSPGSGSQYLSFFRNDTTFITELDQDRTRGGLSNNLRLGADYFFNPDNILTSAFNWRYGNDDNLSTIIYRDFINNSETPSDVTRRTDDEKETEPNLEYSLDYKKRFRREGREFNASFRFQDNSEHERSDYREQYFRPDGAPSGREDYLQRSDNRESERNFILQADYIHPFGKEGKFEAGYRGGIRDIRNKYRVEERVSDEWRTLPGLSNDVLYDENIQAMYATLGNKIGRLSWQGGLRLEVSDVRTELLETNEVNQRPVYANLFPSAHVGYELGSENSVQVSYSRRIRRPHFRELNPFSMFSDARNFSAGNPDLNPEFTDSYELGHLKRWEAGSLSSSVYYRRTTGVVERIRTQLSDTSALTRPVNLSDRNDIGLEFTASFEPLKVWKINGNLNFFRSVTEGQYEGQDFNAEAYTWFGRVTNRFTLWKKLDVQATFNYRAPRNTTQGKSKALYHADLGMSMDVLNKNATLTFSVRDVFNTRRWRWITEGADFYNEGDFQWRARQMSLTLNYRINRKKDMKPERDGDGEGMDMGYN
ncbi:MAG: TonB-dependent receptor [Thermoanaerobaculia bacterium]|nr:TonB-dependent receptor [Thermoanaerobaculia bacterium]